MNTDALPGSPFVAATADACVTGAAPLGAGYSLDLDPATLGFLLDGTGGLIPANPLTPFLTTGPTGQATIAVPNLNTSAFSLQYGFVNASYPVGMGTSAAFDVRHALTVVCNLGAPVTLGDDDSVNVTTPLFFFYGVCYTDFYINSNGNLTFGMGDGDFSETVSEFLSGQPRIAMWWDDLNPSNGGAISHYDNGIGQAGACFDGVREFFNNGTNSMTCLFTNANVLLSYGQMTSNDGLVGVSPGGNIDPVGTAVDLSVTGQTFPPNTAIYETFGFANPKDFGFGFLREFALDAAGHPVQLN